MQDINAECINAVGGYSCVCPDGYIGDGLNDGAGNGGGCVDDNECVINGCQADAFCENNIGSFECICNDGYEEDPAGSGSCIDVDECLIEGICHPDADCINLIGDHLCVCKDGFDGDGVFCSDFNECTATEARAAEFTMTVEIMASNRLQVRGVTAPDECADIANCINIDGGYTCECPEVNSKFYSKFRR